MEIKMKNYMIWLNSVTRELKYEMASLQLYTDVLDNNWADSLD